MDLDPYPGFLMSQVSRLTGSSGSDCGGRRRPVKCMSGRQKIGVGWLFADWRLDKLEQNQGEQKAVEMFQPLKRVFRPQRRSLSGTERLEVEECSPQSISRRGLDRGR